MFKIPHPNLSDDLLNFKWKWWHDTDAKRDVDAKRIADAKRDVDATQSPPNKKAKKESP